MSKSRVKVIQKIREKILELTELVIQKMIKRKWKVAEWLPEKEGKKKLKNAENKKVMRSYKRCRYVKIWSFLYVQSGYPYDKALTNGFWFSCWSEK